MIVHVNLWKIWIYAIWVQKYILNHSIIVIGTIESHIFSMFNPMLHSNPTSIHIQSNFGNPTSRGWTVPNKFNTTPKYNIKTNWKLYRKVMNYNSLHPRVTSLRHIHMHLFVCGWDQTATCNCYWLINRYAWCVAECMTLVTPLIKGECIAYWDTRRDLRSIRTLHKAAIV